MDAAPLIRRQAGKALRVQRWVARRHGGQGWLNRLLVAGLVRWLETR